MNQATPDPQPGDRVRVSFEGEYVRRDPAGAHVVEHGAMWHYTSPDSRVEVIEPLPELRAGQTVWINGNVPVAVTVDYYPAKRKDVAVVWPEGGQIWIGREYIETEESQA
jgi:hypothetical protein